MKTRNVSSAIPAIILSALLLILIGCSGGGTPTEPENTPAQAQSNTKSNRVMVGYWTIELDPVNETYKIIPKRDIAFHAAVRYFLEKAPCSNCISFDDIIFLPGDRVRINVRIIHPFDDPFLDCFDVRGIVFLPYTRTLGGLRISEGVMEDPDGWTRLYNILSIPGDLNPFRAFNKTTTRRRFAAGTSTSAWMEFDFSDVGWIFDYEVDVSWDWPDGDIFPTTANMEEAYEVNPNIIGAVDNDGTLTAVLEVEAKDWQGHNTIDTVTASAPALFNGTKTLTKVGGAGRIGNYEVNITNEKLVSAGTYPILITVTDINSTGGNHLASYQLGWIEVIPNAPDGSVLITSPVDDTDQYINVDGRYLLVKAQVYPPVPGESLDWWWTDPDDPGLPGAFGEGGSYEDQGEPDDSNGNDNEKDYEAGIRTSSNPEQFLQESIPPSFYYHNLTSNSSGQSTVTFRTSTYGGDNYEVHVRRSNPTDEDTSPLITVKREVTLYKSAMSGFLPDSSYVQNSYDPAYIDFNFVNHNLNVPYIGTLTTDATWLYNWCQDIYDPTNHQLADVGGRYFSNVNVLGIALYLISGPAQHTILAVGRIEQYYGPNIMHDNAILIHELGHNFGLGHSTGVMSSTYTGNGERRFNRTDLTYLRSNPAWE